MVAAAPTIDTADMSCDHHDELEGHSLNIRVMLPLLHVTPCCHAAMLAGDLRHSVVRMHRWRIEKLPHSLNGCRSQRAFKEQSVTPQFAPEKANADPAAAVLIFAAPFASLGSCQRRIKSRSCSVSVLQKCMRISKQRSLSSSSSGPGAAGPSLLGF